MSLEILLNSLAERVAGPLVALASTRIYTHVFDLLGYLYGGLVACFGALLQYVEKALGVEERLQCLHLHDRLRSLRRVLLPDFKLPL